MSEQPGQSRRQSFWTTLPGILTGIAAVVTALGGMIAVLEGRRGPPESEPTVIESAAGAPASETAPGPLPEPSPPVADPVAADACTRDLFTDLASARVKTVEEGTGDQSLLDATQPKTGAIGIRFTELGRPIGALRFHFFRENELFKVERLVDAACVDVTGYRNAARGGDPTALQNWDDLEFRLGDRLYVLRLGHSGGEVGINYFRRVVD